MFKNRSVWFLSSTLAIPVPRCILQQQRFQWGIAGILVLGERAERSLAKHTSRNTRVWNLDTYLDSKGCALSGLARRATGFAV